MGMTMMIDDADNDADHDDDGGYDDDDDDDDDDYDDDDDDEYYDDDDDDDDDAHFGSPLIIWNIFTTKYSTLPAFIKLYLRHLRSYERDTLR